MINAILSAPTYPINIIIVETTIVTSFFLSSCVCATFCLSVLHFEEEETVQFNEIHSYLTQLIHSYVKYTLLKYIWICITVK